MEKTLVMKRECIAERGIWTAKKRYILNVWDNEGVRYAEPSLKMMGIEAVKSSTPAPCRGYIKDCLNIIMSGTETDLINYIEKTRAEHAALPLKLLRSLALVTTSTSSRTAQLSTVSLLLSTFVVLLLHNHYLKERGIEKKYNIINDGEKIKFCFLKKPNPIGENVISFIAELPHEFGLKEYLDYDMMYTKGFLDPLQAVLDTIGWKTEKVGPSTTSFPENYYVLPQ